jgi:hypothetical protein
MIKRTTLWEIIMKQFSPDFFVDLAEMLGKTTGMNIGAEIFGKDRVKVLKNPIKDETREELIGMFTRYEQECLRLNLSMSAKAINKLIRKLSESTLTYGEAGKSFQELKERLVDEMESMVFFSIEKNRQPLLVDKNPFGTEIADAFPSAIIDIEEAGKCLAFERATACVFHLMRVMEVGLRVFGDTLKLPASTNRTWDSILKKCDEECQKPFAQKSSEWKSDEPFFAGATAMLHSVKDAWRNPTMHVEKVYTEEQAEEIWNAVRGFMRHLATKLKEPVFW